MGDESSSVIQGLFRGAAVASNKQASKQQKKPAQSQKVFSAQTAYAPYAPNQPRLNLSGQGDLDLLKLLEESINNNDYHKLDSTVSRLDNQPNLSLFAKLLIRISSIKDTNMQTALLKYILAVKKGNIVSANGLMDTALGIFKSTGIKALSSFSDTNYESKELLDFMTMLSTLKLMQKASNNPLDKKKCQDALMEITQKAGNFDSGQLRYINSALRRRDISQIKNIKDKIDEFLIGSTWGSTSRQIILRQDAALRILSVFLEVKSSHSHDVKSMDNGYISDMIGLIDDVEKALRTPENIDDKMLADRVLTRFVSLYKSYLGELSKRNPDQVKIKKLNTALFAMQSMISALNITQNAQDEITKIKTTKPAKRPQLGLSQIGSGQHWISIDDLPPEVLNKLKVLKKENGMSYYAYLKNNIKYLFIGDYKDSNDAIKYVGSGSAGMMLFGNVVFMRNVNLLKNGAINATQFVGFLATLVHEASHCEDSDTFGLTNPSLCRSIPTETKAFYTEEQFLRTVLRKVTVPAADKSNIQSIIDSTHLYSTAGLQSLGINADLGEDGIFKFFKVRYGLMARAASGALLSRNLTAYPTRLPLTQAYMLVMAMEQNNVMNFRNNLNTRNKMAKIFAKIIQYGFGSLDPVEQKYLMRLLKAMYPKDIGAKTSFNEVIALIRRSAAHDVPSQKENILSKSYDDQFLLDMLNTAMEKKVKVVY